RDRDLHRAARERVWPRRAIAAGRRQRRARAQGGHQPHPRLAHAHPPGAPRPRAAPRQRRAHRHVLLLPAGGRGHMEAVTGSRWSRSRAASLPLLTDGEIGQVAISLTIGSIALALIGVASAWFHPLDGALPG